MSRAASPQEEEVRRALEVLASTTSAQLDLVFEQFSAQLPSGAAAVRNAVAHQRAVDNLESVLVTLPTTLDPATARAAQATENVWRTVQSEFGLLSSSEVGALLGASNANRAYAAQLRQRGELLAAQRRNAYVFPAFQFDREAAEVRRWVAPLLRLAGHSHRSGADVIMWMMSPTTYLGGERPVDHAEDSERVLDVAERAWGVEW